MSITIRPGQCFRTDAFTDAQLSILYNAMVEVVSEEHGEPTGESLYYAQNHKDRYPYFGIDIRDLSTFTWKWADDGPAFHTDITDQLIEEFNKTTVATTTSSLFAVGTKVVPNGFRYSRNSSSEHRYGSNDHMQAWERDKTVLTVRTATEDRVRVEDGARYQVTYHPSELRLATPEEVSTVKALPKVGDIIKDNRDVFLVTNSCPDNDGDLQVTSMTTGSTDYLRVMGRNVSEYTLLGRFNAEGAFEPTDNKNEASPLPPAKWKKGQRVRCISGDHNYITIGNVYTLIEDASTFRRETFRIRILDNDGDRSTYCASYFEAVA